MATKKKKDERNEALARAATQMARQSQRRLDYTGVTYQKSGGKKTITSNAEKPTVTAKDYAENKQKRTGRTNTYVEPSKTKVWGQGRFLNIVKSASNNAVGGYRRTTSTLMAQAESHNNNDNKGYNTYLDNPALKARRSTDPSDKAFQVKRNNTDVEDWTHGTRMKVYEDKIAKADAQIAKSEAQLEAAKEGLGKFGQFGVDLAQQGLLMGADMALSAVTGGVGGLAAMGVRSFGLGANEAAQNGASLDQQVQYGALSSAVETATEKLFQGVTLLKGMYGGGLVSEEVISDYARRWAKNAAKSEIGANIADAAAKMGIAGVGEGLEEIIADAVNPVIKMMSGQGYEGQYTDPEYYKQMARDGLLGGVLGALSGGGSAVIDYRKGGKITTEDLNIAAEEAMKMGEDSDAYQKAVQLQEDIDNGKQITEAQKADLVKAVAQEQNSMADSYDLASAIGVDFESAEDIQLAEEALGDEMGTVAEEVQAVFNTFSASQEGENEAMSEENAEGNITVSDEANMLAMTLRGLPLGNAQAQIQQLLPGNEAARSAFTKITGLQLPENNQGTIQAVQNYMRTARVDLQNSVYDKLNNKFNEIYQPGAVATMSTYGEHGQRGYAYEVDRAVKENASDTKSTDSQKRKRVHDTQRAYNAYYTAGMDATPETRQAIIERLEKTWGSSGISKVTRLNAFAAGMNDKEAVRTKAEEKSQGGKTRAKTTKAKTSGRVRNVTPKGTFTDEQIKGFEAFAKAFNVDIVLDEADAKHEGANGSYQNGVITVYKNAKNPFMTVVSHEFTHDLRVKAPKEYQAFADYVAAQFSLQDPERWEQMVNAKLKTYHDAGEMITRDEAIEEILADSAERFFRDPEEIMNLAKTNKNLAQKIIDFLDKVINSLKSLFNKDAVGYGSFYDELGILEQARDLYARAVSTSIDYTGGTAVASDGKMWSIPTENEPGPKPAFARKSGKEKHADGMAKAGTVLATIDNFPVDISDVLTAKELKKAENGGKVTISARQLRNAWQESLGKSDQVGRLNKFFDHLAEYLDSLQAVFTYVDFSHATSARVKFTKDANGEPQTLTASAMVANDEYEINFDFSTICKKREAMAEVIECLANMPGYREGSTMYEDVMLDADGVATINAILAKHGLETACPICFVETKRAALQKQAGEVVSAWNNGLSEDAPYFNAEDFMNNYDQETINAIFQRFYDKGGSTGNRDHKLSNLAKEFGFRLKTSDYVTPEGQAALKGIVGYVDQKNSKGVQYNLYTYIKGTLGQTAGKETVAFTPYNGEISMYPEYMGGKTLQEHLAEIGGARMQSFSDFQIENVFDYCQMVADLATRDLVAHAYTKEIIFAKLFGLTGIKVNLSGVCDIDPSLDAKYAGLKIVGKDSDGNPIYDYNQSEQSIDLEEAYKLQAKPGYGKNCGIIMVGLSDEHIRKMLLDERIKYIIPYHKSSLPSLKRYGKKGKTTAEESDLYEAGLITKRDLNGAKDYTSYQNTLAIKSCTKNGKEFNLDLAQELADRNGDVVATMKWLNGEIEAERLKIETTAAGHGSDSSFNIYTDPEKGLAGTSDPRKTSMEYVKDVLSQGKLPVFYTFLTSQEYADNYYKMVFDFSVYDENGKYAPQEPVHNNYPGMDVENGQIDINTDSEDSFGSILKGGFEERNKAGEHKSKVMGDVIREAVDSLPKRYSLSEETDSEGRPITQEQSEYFKDSKIRDENGNLKVMYHGTDQAGFTVFDPKFSDDGISLFFSDSVRTARSYSGTEDKFSPYHPTGTRGNYPVYLNIKNPKIISNNKGRNWNNLVQGKVASRLLEVEDIDEDTVFTVTDFTVEGSKEVERISTEDVSYDVLWKKIKAKYGEDIAERLEVGTFESGYSRYGVDWDLEKDAPAKKWKTRELVAQAKAEGYDGIIFEQIADNGKYAREYKDRSAMANIVVAFESNQIKSIYNANPTEDADIRYSLSEDSEGNKLTVEQDEYFKDSQIRDDQGRLMKLFHGTNEEFYEFKFDKGGKNGIAEGYGIYLAGTREVSKSYGNRILEVYANIKRPARSDQKTMKKSELKKLIKATCETEAEKMLADYDGNKNDALRDTWISNYVFTYDKSIAESYAEVADLIISENDNDMDIIREVMNGQGIRDYESAMNFYDILTRETGFDGFATKWDDGADIVLALKSNQVKETSNLKPTGDVDIRYSLVGTRKDGIEVYETSGKIKALPYKERQRVFLELMENEYRGRTAKFYKGNEVFYAQFSSKTIKKNIFGDRKSETKGWKAKVNAGADGDIFELVEKAKYSSTSPEMKNHSGVKYWDYFVKTVQIDNRVYDLLANVQRLYGDDNYIYFLELRENKKIKAAPPLTPSNGVNSGVTTASEEMVPQNNKHGQEKYSISPKDKSYAMVPESSLKEAQKEIRAEQRRVKAREKDIAKQKAYIKEMKNISDVRAIAEQFGRDYTLQPGEVNKLTYQLRRAMSKADNPEAAVEHVMAAVDILTGSKAGGNIIADDAWDAVVEAVANPKNDKNFRNTYGDQIARLKNELAQTKLDYAKRNKDRQNRKKRRETIDKIKKSYERLSAKLQNPTDTNHLPDGFGKAVADFLAPFDFATDRTDPESKAGKAREEQRININDLAKRLNEAANDQEGTSIVVDFVQAEFANEISGMLQNKRVSDLSDYELEKAYQLIKNLEKIIYNVNQSFTEGISAGIAERATKAVDEIKERNKVYKKSGLGDTINSYITSNVKPRDFFRVLTKEGGALYEAYMAVRKAFNRHVDNMTDFRNAFEKAVNYKQVREWRKQSTRFKLESGQEIRLTVPQIMSLYELNKREQARGHIYGVGLVASDEELSRKAKKEDKGGKNRDEFVNKRVSVTYNDIVKITSTLTDEQRAAANKLQKIMSNMGSAWGNEASLKMYNFRKFNEADYFPITVLNTWLDEKAGVAQPQRLRTLGMTKKLTPNANNPLVVDDIFSVTIDHMNKMSMYTMTPELTDFERIWNYKDKQAGVSLREEFEATYGKNATAYVRNLMNNINGFYTRDDNILFFDKMLSKFKRAKVGASLRVLVQQPTSIIRAATQINGAYLAAAVPKNTVAVRKNMQEMWAHNATARWKSWGFNEVDTAKSMESIVENKRELADITMGPYGLADNMTWATIWQAVKLETAKKHKDVKKGSDEYWTIVNERFDEIVDYTQVVDSVFHRSQLMRSKNVFAKGITAFMSEPTTTVNMLRTECLIAAQESEAGEKGKAAKRISKVISTLVINGVAVSAAAALIDAMRHSWAGDDDDDEDKNKTLVQLVLEGAYEKSGVEVLNKIDEGLTAWKSHPADEDMGFLERWLVHSKKNLPGNINPLQMLPGIKDVFSLIDGYSVERADISLISNIIDSIDKFNGYMQGDSSYSLWYILNDMLGAVGDYAGVPYRNTFKDAQGIARTVAEAMGHGDYANFIYNSMMYSQKSWNQEAEAKSYINAIKKGNTEDARKIKEALQNRYGISEGDFDEVVEDVITSGLSDAINSGDRNAITEIRGNLISIGYTSEGVDEVVNSAYKKAFRDALGTYDTNNIRIIANRMESTGFTRDDIKSIAKSKYSGAYKDAYIAGNRAEMRQIEQASKAAGLSAGDFDSIKAVVDKDLYKIAVYDAYQNGDTAEYNRLMAQASNYYKNANTARYGIFERTNMEELKKEYGK